MLNKALAVKDVRDQARMKAKKKDKKNKAIDLLKQILTGNGEKDKHGRGSSKKTKKRKRKKRRMKDGVIISASVSS